MRNAKYMLAVTFLATSLCAQRESVVTPSRPPVTQVAGRLMQRLGDGFRRDLPAARLFQGFTRALPPVRVPPLPPVSPLVVHTACLLPFQFRLPPPAA